MSSRIREDILSRVFRENDLSPACHSALLALDASLASSSALTPLPPGPDSAAWDAILAPFLAARETWLTAPWLVAEFYFYRRVVSAVRWFDEGVDPFAKQKTLGVCSSEREMQGLVDRLGSGGLREFVLAALWGNRMDLSIWPVGSERDEFDEVIAAGKEFLLADDVEKLVGYVEGAGVGRFDIIVDNAGFEVFCDLCLADYLIASGTATRVVLHLKSQPTFVSDALGKDVWEVIDFMRQGAMAGAGERWARYVESGKWVLKENDFWVQPSAMWEMPERVRVDMAEARVVFVKGDANYRRLLGDRHWGLQVPFGEIVCYFPTAVCALRTLKAEIGCGLPGEDVLAGIRQKDANWLVNGKYGVVHFQEGIN